MRMRQKKKQKTYLKDGENEKIQVIKPLMIQNYERETKIYNLDFNKKKLN